MSLKARIILLTVTVTASIVAALFLVQLNNVIESWLNSALEIAEIAGQQVKHLLIIRLQERTPAGLTATAPPMDPREIWTLILREDRNLTSLLEATMAQSHALIEISIAGEDGKIIGSSNPARPGKQMESRPDLRALKSLSPLRRAERVLWGGNDFEIRVTLGLANQPRPVFTIQAVISSVLLRNDLVPAMRRVAGWGLSALLASVVLAYASASLAVRNVRRLGVVIDRITSGEEPHALSDRGAAASEFAVIESKLNILGHQYRGAMEGATELRSNVQRLLERLEEAILLFDSEQRLVLAAGAAERILGFPIAAVADRHLEDAFPPQSPLGAFVQQAFLLRRRFKDHPVDWMRGKSVAHLLVSIEFMPASIESERSSALVRIRDAEGHQQLESHLGLSARLDAMNRITSSVAHEIKNPLNSIAARLDYLQSWATEDFPEAEEEIQFIFKEVNRLDRVVRSFLDFTRPVELAQDEVDVVGLTAEVAGLVKVDAARHGVAVHFDSSKDRILVCGDPDLLKEAIMNVVTNGIEAMPSGGQLEIGLQEADGHCRIIISDTGTGIAESQRDKIFQLYFSTKENGSGLGLPMSYRAIELHGGSIDLESEPGKGTSFCLNLPVMAVGNPR